MIISRAEQAGSPTPESNAEGLMLRHISAVSKRLPRLIQGEWDDHSLYGFNRGGVTDFSLESKDGSTGKHSVSDIMVERDFEDPTKVLSLEAMVTKLEAPVEGVPQEQRDTFSLGDPESSLPLAGVCRAIHRALRVSTNILNPPASLPLTSDNPS